MIWINNYLKKNFKRLFATSCAVLMGFMLFAGCGVGTDVSSDENIYSVTSAKDMRKVKFREPNNLIEGAPNIYVILKSTEGNYWEHLSKGVQKGGIDFGCNIYMAEGLSFMKWDAQKKLIEDAIEADADAIILAPENSHELNSSIGQVHDLGKPVVLVDTITNTESFDICYMTDNLKAGEDAAKELLAMMKSDEISEQEKFEVAIIVGNTESQTVNERLAGFLQYWSINAPQNWEVTDNIESVDEYVSVAEDTTSALLLNNNSIRAIFSGDSTSSQGVAQEVKRRGRSDIYLACFDYSKAVEDVLKDDEYNAFTIIQKQYDMGYKGVMSARSLIYGDSVSEKFVDTGVVILRQEDYKNGVANEASKYIDSN